MNASLSIGARYLKRGDTFDPEDHRMTHRLGVARRLLASEGVEPTWTHSDRQVADFGRLRHECDYRCKASWPEWVGAETFNAAFALADAIQNERGGAARSAAYAARI